MDQDKRKKMLAAVHIKKAQLNLTDEDYRAILWENFGKGSAGDLSGAQLSDLLNILEYIHSGKPMKPRNLINKKQYKYLMDLCRIKDVEHPAAYVSAILHHKVENIESQVTRREAGLIISKLQKKR